jgi:hypothetical protein
VNEPTPARHAPATGVPLYEKPEIIAAMARLNWVNPHLLFAEMDAQRADVGDESPAPGPAGPIREWLAELARPMNGKVRTGLLDNALRAVLDLCDGYEALARDGLHPHGPRVDTDQLRAAIADAIGVTPWANVDELAKNRQRMLDEGGHR